MRKLTERRGEGNLNSKWWTTMQLPALLLVLVLALAGSGETQTPTQSQNQGLREGQGQIQEVEKRAEQEAEQMVSLSADAIQEILRREPGLLLEVKKTLVRKAYQQGRLLDPADLTDEALFQLLQQDNNVRILATREIESRMYVRAKPNAEELGQTRERRTAAGRGSPEPGTSGEQQSSLGAQENQYWSTHEEIPPRTPPQSGVEPNSPQETEPSPVPPEQEGVPEPAPDNRRPQDFAAAQAPDVDSPDVVSRDVWPSDVGELPRMSPAELPGVLSASMTEPEGSNSLSERASGNSAERGNVSALQSNSAFGSSASYSDFGQQSLGSRETQTRLRSPERGTWQRPAIPNYAQPAIRHQPNPYANVPSLYDLYQQVSQRSLVPQRFGMDVFRNGTGNFDELPMDTPAGPDYVLGPGDGLSIEIWGSVSGRLQRVVDRQGVLTLPETGGVQVAGKTLGEVQRLVQSTLRTQYRQAEADVSLARLRTVRVYVVGDVVRPGAYDVSALSTPLNALYLAGGPTARGSLRVLRHSRGNQLLETIDIYELLLHGVRPGGQRLEAGDTIQVPPLGAEVTVEGMVRRPAVYELDGETKLAEVLEIAGGVLTSGTLRHIEIERVLAHENRTMLRFDLPEGNDQEAANRALADYPVQDGDRIRVSPILPFSEKTVYLDGHVFHPGKYAYREGMRLTDLVHSYNEVLPEPALRHAEIIRLNPPDYAPVVLAFNLAEAMGGTNDIALLPFDTVRIFGRFDFEPPPLITVSGEVRHPGDHLTNGQTSLREAVYLAGGITPDALLSDAQLFHRTPDGTLHVASVNLSQALAGDAADNILLAPMDRLFIHKNLGKADPATVKIEGQVAQPGKYPLGENMTAAELVRLAGGLQRGAYTETADLTRYEVQQGTSIVGEHTSLPLARMLAGEPDTDVRLRDGDVLTIRELAGWHDVGATIAVSGEVQHPGTYGIQEGERLSSILKRAGGFRADAYPYGVILERVQVRELEQANREQLVKQVQMDGSNLTLIPASDSSEKLAKEAAVDQWHTALEKLQSAPPSGRLAIRIGKDVSRWANTSADIQVRAGDLLYVPKKPNFVMVDGAVYNPTAVAYKLGKSAGWYLEQAGGPTNMANKKAMFVIRADGFVAGGAGGLLGGGAMHSAVQPGDLVMVPEKAFSGTTKWKATLESAQLAYAVGVAIEVARSF
jgi:protein involved in polysaccharide export with SLBB domain